MALALQFPRPSTASWRRPALSQADRPAREELIMAIEELRIHTETDAERVGKQADADTERLADEDSESAEERRRSAYRLT
jgi:hypothetical protein